MLFRKEDHQLLQPMYAFKIKVDPNVPWAIPELTHVITMDEMKIPIANNVSSSGHGAWGRGS